jgi:hypothetical protein
VGLGIVSPWLFLRPSGILIGGACSEDSDWAGLEFQEEVWKGTSALLTAPLVAVGEVGADVEVAIVEDGVSFVGWLMLGC